MTERFLMLPPAANSVHAFSHQRAPDDRPDETPLGDSPKPVRGLTRRSALAGLAMLPVAVPAVGAAVDPVFELIEAHRKAHAAHMASLELGKRFELRYGLGREIGSRKSRATTKTMRSRNWSRRRRRRCKGYSQSWLISTN